ncbi:Protein unc-13 C [Thoreauomyces humboldtii]|nr:Protein unc-13 C [Thoreauomyces humboldtii]
MTLQYYLPGDKVTTTHRLRIPPIQLTAMLGNMDQGQQQEPSVQACAPQADSASILTQDSATTSKSSAFRVPSGFSKLLSPGGVRGGQAEDKVAPPSPAPPPSDASLRLAAHFCDVLNLDAGLVEQTRLRLMEACAGPELVGADLTAYRFLLGMDMGVYRKRDHTTDGNYASWKLTEQASLDKLMAQSGLHFAGDDPSDWKLILITVVSAENLMSKDPNGSSNPYCVVHANGSSFVSEVLYKNCSPAWEFRVAIPLRSTSEPPVICIWNRSSDHRAPRRQDSFLGTINITPYDVIRATNGGIFEADLPLCKRSSRSHVTGKVHVIAEQVHSEENVDLVYRRTLRFIPAASREAYRIVLRAVLDHDVGRDTSYDLLITEFSKKGLEQLAEVWRIGESTRAIVYFETLTALFAQGAFPATVLESHGSAKVELLAASSQPLAIPDLNTFRETCRSLTALLMHQLRTFFNHPLTSRKAKDLTAMTGMLAMMETNPLLDKPEGDLGDAMKELLKHALDARYLGLHAIAHSTSDAVGPEALIKLITAIETELASYDEHLDVLYFKFVHIPDIAATVFFERLMPDLTAYTSSPAHARNFADAFELFAAVRSLEEVYMRVDFRLAEQFNLTEWFSAPFREWVAVSEKKFIEWMQAAVEVDEYQHSAPTALYSSSVLDIFTSFQQQIDFALNLNWPDKEQEHAVLLRLVEAISDTLVRYIEIMVQKIGQDLARCRTGDASRRLTPRVSIKKKSKMNLKFGKSKKSRNIDPAEIRIPIEACVKMENINIVPSLFAALLHRVFPSSDFPPPLPPKPTDPPPLVAPRTPLAVTLLYVDHLTPTRPYATQVYVRVRVGGKDIGHTSPVPQARRIEWALETAPSKEGDVLAAPRPATFYLLPSVDAPPPDLDVSLMHRVPGQPKDYLFGRAALPAAEWVGRREVLMDLGVSRGFAVSGQSPSGVTFLNKLLDKAARDGISDASALVADQLTHDLRARLKSLSKTYKTSWTKNGKFQSMLTKLKPGDKDRDSQHTPSTTPTTMPTPQQQQDMEQTLATLLNYMDVNLEILTEGASFELAMQIVAGTWDVIPGIVESLVTDEEPDDATGTSTSGSTPTSLLRSTKADPGRVAFMTAALACLHAWFAADGDGLPEARMDGLQSYRDCVRCLQHALMSRKDCERLWRLESVKGADMRDWDWLLRLTAARGGKDFVEGVYATRIRGATR